MAEEKQDTSSSETKNDPGKMFIGGLHNMTTAESLQAYFEKFGEIKECVVMRDPITKRSRGFGFVTFSDASVADEVLETKMHIVDCKKVDPKKAIPKKNPNQFRKVFVGGLPANTTSSDVRTYFEQFGKVTEVLLMYDKATQRLRGFGFVTFEGEDAAKNVCEETYHKIKGKNVECKRAQPKEVMGAISGRGRAPFIGRGFVGFPPLYNRAFGPGYQIGYGFPEWTPVDPQTYQQLAKFDGYSMAAFAAYSRGRGRGRSAPMLGYPGPGFPSGSSFMSMPDHRRHSQYYGDYGNMPSPAVRGRQEQTGSGSSSNPPSSMHDYDYGVQVTQVNQYTQQQGNLGPPPSPLNQSGFNPANSPGPDISYISSTRGPAPHELSVYGSSSSSQPPFAHGMAQMSLRQ